MMNLNSNHLVDLIHQVEYDILPIGVQLRPLQLEAVIAALKSENSIISMATGAGKTYVFLVASEAFARFREKRTLTIVLSPLIALLDQQVQNHPDKEAMIVNEDSIAEDLYDSVKLNFHLKYLYMCPETLASKFTKVLSKLVKEDDLDGMIIVDEAHLIATCDDSFRQSYAELPKYIPSSVKLLMLSGTFTVNVLLEIDIRFKSYRPLTTANCTIVHGNIDRSDLVYCTKKLILIKIFIL